MVQALKKLNRKYRLTIQDVDENREPINKAVVIENPFTIRFSINRNIFQEVNQGDFEIYNLAPDTYNRLFYDYFSINRYFGDDETTRSVGNKWKSRTVILEAGYEGMEMSIIFVGDMWSCYTERRGSDVITRIHAIIGLRATSISSDVSFGSTTRNKVLMYLADDMHLKMKLYQIEDKEFNRPISISGNSFANIQKYSGDIAYIDNNEIKVLKYDDAFESEVALINDESGLLGVPQRENGILSVNMIFEPRLTVGQIIEIQSRIAPMFNGQYKVFGLKHDGVISGAESNRVVTSIQMMVGSQLYGRFGIVKAQ